MPIDDPIDKIYYVIIDDVFGLSSFPTSFTGLVITYSERM